MHQPFGALGRGRARIVFDDFDPDAPWVSTSRCVIARSPLMARAPYQSIVHIFTCYM